MSDVVVTLPLSFGIEAWIEEGDPAGEAWSGQEWCFSVAGQKPKIEPGERVYVVFNRRLIGYAPLIRLEILKARYWGLIRGGGAVAVTIPQEIRGFRGWQYRFWARENEVACEDWRRAPVIPVKRTREEKQALKEAEKLGKWNSAAKGHIA